MLSVKFQKINNKTNKEKVNRNSWKYIKSNYIENNHPPKKKNRKNNKTQKLIRSKTSTTECTVRLYCKKSWIQKNRNNKKIALGLIK